MFVGKVKKTIKKYRMLEAGDKVVVGVSGGPDSMALLYVLNHIKKDYNLTLKVAHLNHSFRGKEAQREAQFVEKMSQKLELPFEVKTLDVPAYKKEHSLSSQEAARVIRYRFLEDVKKRFCASKIALGHNADDQAETMVMWLLRGTGLKGLGGMPPVREGGIIRPLVETTRKEIEVFLRRKEIPFVMDSSNQNLQYLRNRLRHELFPLLRERYNPQLVKNLVQTASVLRMEDEYLESIAKNALKKILVSKDGDSVVIENKSLLTLPLAIQLRCLRGVVEQVKGDLKRITSTHLYDIIKVVSNDMPNKLLTLPQGITVEKSYKHLIIKPYQTSPSPFCYQFKSIPDRVLIEEIGKEMNFEIIKGDDRFVSKRNNRIACFDAAKVLLPITIRNPKPGDRFQPLGMKGEKKIKDFFIDEKIPLKERKRVPLVFFGDFLGWVGGMRINDRFRATKDTREILKIEVN